MRFFTAVLYLSALFIVRPQAQDPCPDCPPNGSDTSQFDVIKVDERMSQFDFVPGQIIIRVKDDINTAIGKSGSGYATLGINTIDVIFSQYKIHTAKKVFPDVRRQFQREILTLPTGEKREKPNLHNIFLLEGDSTLFVMEVIEALKLDANILYAEPNYYMSIVESTPVSPVLSENEMKEWIKSNSTIQSTVGSSSTVPNDPFYPQQWGIPISQIDQVWDSTKGDTNHIIAVLDTGVDWLHPDLVNKIWLNPGEIPANGIDDDNNGFVDDVRGWDWINNDNDPKDDNSHGTHVAGIAAAESNNNIGIAGVNWGAKIMPLKVFQSSGRGDFATITQGIQYASNMGATVINMSFGSYARSFAMEDALAVAYASSILVAAAGNDGKGIGPNCTGCAPFFPAALPFVLGIEAPPQPPIGFTNFDQDGPVFSGYPDLLNYELKAAGVNVVSCVPGGNYRFYNGTSMAAPLVAGAVAIYRSEHPEHSQELMWGNLINTATGIIKLNEAINIAPKPILSFVASKIVDTLDGDRDGRPDAGETIELWFKVRNTWGQADSVYCGIQFSEFEDTTAAKILSEPQWIGSVSSFATRTNELNPLRIKISQYLSHNRDIVFETLLFENGSPDTTRERFIINIENGIELAGIIDDTLTLYPNKFYLVTNNVFMSSNAVLNIMPGTVINFYDGKSILNDGVINSIGNKDSMIIFTNAGSSGWGGINFGYGSQAIFKYCQFSEMSRNTMIGSDGGGYYEDCVIRDNFYNVMFLSTNNFVRCNWYNNSSTHIVTIFEPAANQEIGQNLNIINNRTTLFPDRAGLYLIGVHNTEFLSRVNIINNRDATNRTRSLRSHDIPTLYRFSGSYLGTTDSNKLADQVWDFFDDGNLAPIEYSGIRTIPLDSAHGIVWKVLVNGKDAQDERVDPLGVGPHRFDVYFNRPMDTSYTPGLTFGVRAPYTQQAVVDSSFWSADHKVWTAYHTVKLYTGDGINTIRVSGARDLDKFEIPVEDQRFSFLIDAAGSASVDFTATAGLGKVTLEIPTPDDLPTFLGHNLYRFTTITDTTFTEPVLLNSSLIVDSVYVDYQVEPNRRYYYKYTIVRTDFTESDFSKVVNAKVLTATKGDANGDMAVNILDITSIVGYLLVLNPQPFIFGAADVNDDGNVNVLDIVGVVNLIMNDGMPKIASSEHTPKLSFDQKGAWIEYGSTMSAMQLKLTGKDLKNTKLVPGPGANGMEMSYNITGDTLHVVMFSFSNRSQFGKERSLLFSLSEGNLMELKEVVASDPAGAKVEVSLANDGVIIPKEFSLYQNYPNPFNPTTTIRYALPNQEDVEIVIYNIMGQKVWEYSTSMQRPGYYEVIWEGKNRNGISVSSGVYIYQIKAGKFINQKKMVLMR